MPFVEKFTEDDLEAPSTVNSNNFSSSPYQMLVSDRTGSVILLRFQAQPYLNETRFSKVLNFILSFCLPSSDSEHPQVTWRSIKHCNATLPTFSNFVRDVLNIHADGPSSLIINPMYKILALKAQSVDPKSAT